MGDSWLRFEHRKPKAKHTSMFTGGDVRGKTRGSRSGGEERREEE